MDFGIYYIFLKNLRTNINFQIFINIVFDDRIHVEVISDREDVLDFFISVKGRVLI